MNLYIVRHGQALNNSLGCYNTKDEDLTELGIIQATELRDKIKDMNFDIIYASPLNRTRQTANILNIKNQEIIFDKRLEERDCGSLAGQALKATNREEYWNYYTTLQQGTSENIQTFFKRVYEFIDELSKKDYENVLIVAHSGVSKAFSGYFNGIDDGKFLNRGLKNGEILKYEL